MPSHRIVRLLCVLCFLCLASSASVHAQDDPAFTTAAQPYSSYHGGDIDHVDLFSGNLSIDIPLASYPQKGGKLNLSFALHYQSGPATDTYYCDDSGDCWDQWTAFNHGWVAGPTNGLEGGGFPASGTDMQSPYCQMLYNQYDSLYPAYCYYEEWIQSFDQAMHQTLPTTTGVNNSVGWRAIDGSGYINTSNGILDSAGTLYSGRGPLLLDSYLIQPWASYPMFESFQTQITDTNGNTIKGNLTTDHNGIPWLTTWNDTMQRSIPAPVLDSPVSSQCPTGTSDPAQLSGQPNPTSSFLWNFPSANGGTSPVRICLISFTELGPYPDEEIQSIVLPNGTAWTFEYDTAAPNYTGNLTQVNLPTGGAIAYGWTGGPRLCNFSECNGSIVGSRTLKLEDGTATGEWQYDYNQTGSGYSTEFLTTVIDAAGNQAEHYFTNLDTNNDASYYETSALYFQGTNVELKAVSTSYQYITPFDTFWSERNYEAEPELFGYAANVLPSSVTTQLVDTGQSSTVAYTYDTGATFYQPVYNAGSGGSYVGQKSWTASLGRQTSIKQYSYGGSLMRTTTNGYEFQTNANYLSANLLNLPSSISVTGSGTGSSATFGYDENNGSPQCVCGNPTSVHTWLNDSTAATVDCPVSVSNGYLTSYKVYNTDGTLAKSVDSCGSNATDPNHRTTYGYSTPTTPACPNGGGGIYAGTGPTCVTNPLGQTTYYSYDANTGLQTSVQDPNDVANAKATTTTLDSLGRTQSVNYPDGGLTAYCYTDEPSSIGGTCYQSGPPQVIVTDKVTSGTNKTETAVMDGLGRLKQKIMAVPTSTCSGGYAYVDFFYDTMGRQASASNPDCTATTTDDVRATTLYDALGRTCVFIPQDGTSETGCVASAPNDVVTTYSGNTTTVTDEAGKARKSATDALGRLTDVWEAPTNPNLDYHTTYTYDALGNLLSVSQGSQSRTFVYDSLKHLMQSTNPEAGTVCYGTLSGSTCQNNGYDANGNLVYKTDARGITITYAYDYLNRMTGRTYPNAATDPSVSYAYGTTAGTSCPGGAPSYNIGRRISMTDAGGSENFAYDPMGRECWEQRTITTVTPNITNLTSYAYNYDGSLASLTYPSGRKITYTPNIDGQPISAVDTTDGINYVTAATYTPQGTPLNLTSDGSNLVSSFFYSSRLQPCRIATEAGTGASPGSCSDSTTANILDLSYNFNLGTADNGDVAIITNNRDTNRTQTFAYDDLNRLTTGYTTGTHTSDPTMCWGEIFYYDNATGTDTGEYGNLTSIGVYNPSSYTGCTQDSLNVSASLSNNRISTTGFSYDAGGNLTGDNVNTYAWNAESEQKTANTTNYTYDGDGNRLYKASGATPNKIYWYGAGTEILDESDGSGNITNEYVFFGGRRIAMDLVSGTGGGSISTTYYYAEDFLGSSRTMVQHGATTPCFDADFLPFGREKDAVATCTQNNYKFEGKERDTETGNDDFGARYYSSNFGRWLSPDWSSIPAPVPYANLTNPQTLNLYAMVQDNPESFADLDGHKIDPATANGICNTNNATGSCDDWEQSVIYNNTYDAWGYSPEQLAVFINDWGVTGEAYAVATNAEAAEALKAQQQYGRQPDGSYKADPAKVQAAIDSKTPIGNGQCVALCSRLSGVTPHTASWTPGKPVLDLNDTTDVGLAIASFGPNGKFTQPGGDQNSAIYMGHDPKTGQIMVVDQWPPPNAKQYNAPFEHPLLNHGEGHNLQTNRMENNAYYYHAIVVP